ncbi:MAG: hypothetical protein M1820_004639 [Bogoriella megaspora]|nr:MAG: hypothetical protein M1820_004639 [Bogoriella megaspora]
MPFIVLQGAAVWLAYLAASFIVKLYNVRSRFQRMQREGLPMPPHHPLLGHLFIVGGIMAKLPSDVHGHVLPHQIVKLFSDVGPVFYVDTWPFGPPMLVVVGGSSQ